jgi:hypothetical protein
MADSPTALSKRTKIGVKQQSAAAAAPTIPVKTSDLLVTG